MVGRVESTSRLTGLSRTIPTGGNRIQPMLVLYYYPGTLGLALAKEDISPGAQNDQHVIRRTVSSSHAHVDIFQERKALLFDRPTGFEPVARTLVMSCGRLFGKALSPSNSLPTSMRRGGSAPRYRSTRFYSNEVLLCSIATARWTDPKPRYALLNERSVRINHCTMVWSISL